MNSFKAFFKQRGLYLVCLALLLVATVTGVLAIRSVVRNVADLTESRKKALEEDAAWNQPDTIVTNPAEDVPVQTPAPTSQPSAQPSESSASSSSQQHSGEASADGDDSGTSAASSAVLSTSPADSEPIQGFSGSELVYNETLGDWRTHNGADYAAETGDEVHAVALGTVLSVDTDPLWGTVAVVKSGDGSVWRYCGLDKAQVKEGDTVTRGQVLGTLGTIPSENGRTHLHLECLDETGAYLDPESMMP